MYLSYVAQPVLVGKLILCRRTSVLARSQFASGSTSGCACSWKILHNDPLLFVKISAKAGTGHQLRQDTDSIGLTTNPRSSPVTVKVCLQAHAVALKHLFD